MAYTTIDKPSDYFNTSAVWSGDDSEHTISGIEHQPDFTWIKGVNIGTQHYLFDSVRGATKILISNGTNAEFTVAQTLKSWNSDGFVLGTSDDVNGSGRTYVSWNWKESATAGIDIVTYSGSSASSKTISHSLSAVPKMIIVKCRSAAENWSVYHHALGNTHALFLNTTGASSDTPVFADTTPTSSVFSVSNDDRTGADGKTYVAYVFAEKQGFSKFGKFYGNGNVAGTFVHLGFKPAFVMVKQINASGEGWHILDNKRSGVNGDMERLLANSSNAESNYAGNLDLLSNGFKTRINDAGVNGSGASYIYMAFAEQPFVTSTGVPATAC